MSLNKFIPEYDISNGSINMQIRPIEFGKNFFSLQIKTSASFDGTTATAKLIQSNDLNAPFNQWHDLPETPLTLITGSDSNLLQTRSLTCRFVGVVIVAGDSNAGILPLLHNNK